MTFNSVLGIAFGFRWCEVRGWPRVGVFRDALADVKAPAAAACEFRASVPGARKKPAKWIEAIGNVVRAPFAFRRMRGRIFNLLINLDD